MNVKHFLIIFIVCMMSIFSARAINIDVNYSKILTPTIDRNIYGMNGYPNTLPKASNAQAYAVYTNLINKTGVTHLHVPGDAYYGGYDWVAGSSGEYNLSDWKKLSDDTGVALVGIISPHYYYSGPGGQGHDPAAIVQWAKNSGWDPEKWKYWVIGCENYGSWDADKSTPTEYAAMINDIVPKMKAVAPNIKVGFTCDINYQDIWRWCDTVVQLSGNNLDFVDQHWYPHDGYTNPYGTMAHYMFFQSHFVPLYKNLFNTYNGGKQLPIYVGEYDFWSMNQYPNGATSDKVVRKNAALADALAWGDFLGTSIFNNLTMMAGYDFVSDSTYGQLMPWLEYDPQGQYRRAIKYRTTVYMFELWTKHFGTMMAQANVIGSPTYITYDGRPEYANVICCDWNNPPNSSYTPVPVNYITAYAGMDPAKNKTSLFIINKHNNTSYPLTINLTGITIQSTAVLYNFSTNSPYGLLAENEFYNNDPPEVIDPTITTAQVGSLFNYTIGPHSMTVIEFTTSSSSCNSNCSNGIDADCNNKVDGSELNAAINSWYSDQITINQLMSIIRQWKANYC